MMTTIEIINLASYISAFVILSMLMVGTVLSGNLKQQKATRWFLVLLLLNMAGILVEITGSILSFSPLAGSSIDAWTRIMEALSYAVWGLQHYALIRYIYEYIAMKKPISRKSLYLAALLTVTNTLLSVIAPFNQMYGVASADSFYQQGDRFWISTVLPICSLAVYSIVVVKNAEVLRAREWFSLLLYAAALLASAVTPLLFPGLWIQYFITAASSFLIYINIQVEVKQQMQEQEIRIQKQEMQMVESSMAVMLSQIQPHFLYNSLSVISKLCYDNDEAQEAIQNFSSYLRTNMDSLTEKHPIPFADELEHVKQYLWLEEQRFEERLQVIYDIQTVDFHLPALTLQPIVENAVRHGVNKREDGGAVTIRAEEAGDYFRIIVTDDGIGFDPSAPLPSDGNSHTGIQNVRGRLAAMCGGQLLLESTPGKGTIATIEIPKEG